MPSQARIPWPVVAGLFVAIALDTGVQIGWKLAVFGVPENASVSAVFAAAANHRYFYFAMLAFGAQFVNWMSVLSRADLSFAQPITALSYISLLALSGRFLHEELSAAKMLGVAMILLGIFFISRTPHLTVPE